MEEVVVSAITLNKAEAKITVCNVPDRPGIAAKIFNELADKGVSVDMIVQNVSHLRQTDISFTVNKPDSHKAIKIIGRLKGQVGIKDIIEDFDIARISIVGVGMKSHPGVAGKMFEVLAKNKINIEMISTSDISISCIVQRKFAEDAVRALHSKFGLDK